MTKLPGSPEVLDLTEGYHPRKIYKLLDNGIWAVGGYGEKRKNMYTAPQYRNLRNIHMGIDIWAPAGEPVFAVLEGEVVYLENHDQEGNYGPTIVLKHRWQNKPLYALYGHLSEASLQQKKEGDRITAGDRVGFLGDESENGNWPPHLHYQLCRVDPGEADMPGVVSADELPNALKTYPDPRIILGPVY